MTEAERERAKLATRKRDGRCVCCGYSNAEHTLECGCGFCLTCVERRHDHHEQEWGVECVDLSAPGTLYVDE